VYKGSWEKDEKSGEGVFSCDKGLSIKGIIRYEGFYLNG